MFKPVNIDLRVFLYDFFDEAAVSDMIDSV